MAALGGSDTIRLNAEPEPGVQGDDVIVEIEDGGDVPEIDDDGAILRIEHGDGSLTVSLNGQPLSQPNKPDDDGWYANLVDKIDDMELGIIVNDLMRGIDDDMTSRQEWVEAQTTGIKLLGLQIEVPGLTGASDGAPVEGMSKVRDSMLLEAVLRFQANARSELLPTDGPVKVRDDSHGGPQSAIGATVEQDRLADALEEDLNHYLTAVATEYYPDTDRMLFKLGFGGTSFKKVYFCPLRGRPVSETVDAGDLIVNASATDLGNAKRVTHRIDMRPSTVKRMQILGAYRDIDLSTPMPPKLNSLQRQEKAQQGVNPNEANPEDRDRELYECYCELNVKGFEHRFKGKDTGLEIPYRVTIDVSSREILSIVRNYDEETKDLPRARKVFVKYTFVPGLGFYDIGLLHILGNTTNAITAAVREMLDNGMYANFPGFLMSDTGGRQNTNIFRVPPGGAAPVKTGGMDIRQAIMPLPYNTQQMAPLMALIESMRQQGMRIGGTSEQQVGEGRADAPVGTTLAMIDQATKVLNSVHKRMHASQAEEFSLMIDVFRDHPESFWAHKCPSKTPWSVETFLKALDDCDLVPQADPNTASHGQRVMKVMGLKQLQAASPALYDPLAIDTIALQTLGWSNPQQFFAPPAAQAAVPPELQEIQAGIKVAQQMADAKTTEANAKVATAQAKAAEIQAKSQQGAFAPKGLGAGTQQQDTPVDQLTARSRMMDAETKRHALTLKGHEINAELHDHALDREAERQNNYMDIAREVLNNPDRAKAGAKSVKSVEKDVGA